MRARYLVPETIFLSAVYSRRMKKRPFKEWSESIGESMVESACDVPADTYMMQVAFVVNWVCNRVPWQSMCMVRALTAKKLLNRKNYPCTLYMGVKKEADGDLAAHAWLRCGASYITGGNGSKYTVTGKYGDCWEKRELK